MLSIQSFVVKIVFRIIKRATKLRNRSIVEKRTALEKLAKNGSLISTEIDHQVIRVSATSGSRSFWIKRLAVF